METRYRQVRYEVSNPEWERLDGLLASARVKAPVLRGVMDRPSRSAQTALTGGKSDEIRGRVARLKTHAASAADTTVDAIRRKRDAQPRMLSKTRTESYQVWVPDPAAW